MVEPTDGIDSDFWCIIRKVNLSTVGNHISVYTDIGELTDWVIGKNISDYKLVKTINISNRGR